ncbi:Uncharacterized protein APZ42_033040 [Daphnia magna]|uniref:Uncharacterized protein n=1 Tax=Daphnia magna TaxID=35525 RepID=A0A164LG67_9CRUS|nr:Uncharacterized protein APZ42_033040 [Daphnia magna]
MQKLTYWRNPLTLLVGGKCSRDENNPTSVQAPIACEIFRRTSRYSLPLLFAIARARPFTLLS